VSETAFFVLAGLSVTAAGGVVLLRNPVHSALSLIATLFLIAVSFIALDAHLVAALQIIVYAGAVMVLFLFVIMMLNLPTDAAEDPATGLRTVAALTAAVMAAGLGRVLWQEWPGVARESELEAGFGTTVSLARVLFRDHVVAFELTSVMLLTAIVGAVVLARRDRG